jgi:hypothetical protein
MRISIVARTGVAALCFIAVEALSAGAAHAQDAPAANAPAPVAAPAPAESPTASGNHPAPNSIYLEGLGAGLAYSINYERMVIDDLGVRIGFSYLSFSATASSGGATSSSSASFITIPITASYIGIRGRKSSLELGGGMTFSYASGSANGIGASASGSGVTPYGVVMVGYRFQPVDQPGFQFRVGAMALAGEGLSLSANSPGSFGVLPWGYLSMGASF